MIIYVVMRDTSVTEGEGATVQATVAAICA